MTGFILTPDKISPRVHELLNALAQQKQESKYADGEVSERSLREKASRSTLNTNY